MTHLSDHFTLAEAAKSQLAERKGIDNTPPAVLLPRLVRVASQILEPVRRRYHVPFSPSSWYRCPVLNAAVGSKGTSQHVYGIVPDFEDLVGGVMLTVKARMYPNDSAIEYGPFEVSANTKKLDFRGQGRDISILIEGNAAPSFMRFGVLRADVRQTQKTR